jgi:hypothetical protein
LLILKTDHKHLPLRKKCQSSTGLPGPKKIYKAKFGYKQFQKRPNSEKIKLAK